VVSSLQVSLPNVCMHFSFLPFVFMFHSSLIHLQGESEDGIWYVRRILTNDRA
jgi:hypothetical protein